MGNFVDLAPEPKNDIKTYMRMGYNLPSAVADILDNSISAKSTTIEVWSSYRNGDPHMNIYDDGIGMSKDELIENMRIACKNPDAERIKGDLGRFGSGMKTASFSQARKLTVVTKRQGQPLVAAVWDVGVIEKTNSWKLQILEDAEVDALPTQKISKESKSGTEIIWESLTFISSGDHSDDYQDQLDHALEEVRKHVALHFHRFMSGSGKINFIFNNIPVKPIDPFFTNYKGYQEGQYEYLREKLGKVEIQGHILPFIHQLTEPELREDANIEALGGVRAIIQKQGIYVYREKRLIIEGGWLGLSRPSQLQGLARVQVDIPSSFDAEWKTDVKKQTLDIPLKVKGKIKKFLSEPRKKSKRTHKPRIERQRENEYWSYEEDPRTKKYAYLVNKENPQLYKLLREAKPEDRRNFAAYLDQLTKKLPIYSIWANYSSDPTENLELGKDNWFDSLLDEIGTK